MRAAIVMLVVGLLARLALAQKWGILADEAYYWVWSLRPALGYYDQPPLIAWQIAATDAVIGHGPFAIRLVPILCAAGCFAALAPSAKDKELLALWLCLPPLFYLTLFATPDATLLLGWAVALGAACRGGRWWLLAGLGAGIAVLSKYTGAAVMPLLILGAGPKEWKSGWPWAGLALTAACAAPNVAWNAGNGFVSVGFQLQEGLLNPHPPGLFGPLRQIVEQAGVITPLAWLAGIVWAVLTARPVWHSWNRSSPDLSVDLRTLRLAWFTSTPLLVFFALAAVGGPPEAHWPAPAWLSVGLGLSYATGRLERLAGLGVWFGVLLTAIVAVHSVFPILRFPTDPATRLAEGELLGEWVAQWALPEGVGIDDGRADLAEPVLTERYQEAALIHYTTGIEARRLPGCGRADQYDLWAHEPGGHALFVRPATTNVRQLCSDALFRDRSGPSRLRATDDAGRLVEVWEVWEVSR